MLNSRVEKFMEEIYHYKILKAGEIQPRGWIREQLHRDLTEGYIGSFDKVHPTVTHNLFVKQNRQSEKQYKIVKEWWSGEHEGYWKDAVVRMAFLTHNEEYIKQATEWIDDIIENTGEEGYIGIYEDCKEPTCRFNHEKGNGELWTTSRILMAMLAYYEYTGDIKVLSAAEKAVGLIINKYKDQNYFSKSSKGGGVSHGIGFFENLEWLYRITGDQTYLDAAVKLYRDFSQGKVRDDDLKLSLLLDTTRYFRKHGAHVAEGIFVPHFVAAIDGKSEYKQASEMSVKKLNYHITPGGAMRCDEWVKGRKGTADERYEYCGITEMISPLNKMVAFTGDFHLADQVETMTFNAGQGARLPVLKGLSYLTSDNRIKINHKEIGHRESYDASHRAASCCVLNGGRLMPYYVEGMWMKANENDGLVAVLYGPSVVETTIKNVKVKVEEQTNYPFSGEIRFTINPRKNLKFPLILRKPHGCNSFDLYGIDDTQACETKNKITLTKEWKKNDTFSIHFHFEVEKVAQPSSKTVRGGGFYVKRGPLVFALPFVHRIDTIKEYHNSGFYRYRIKALDREGWKYKITADADFTFESDMREKTLLRPWDNPVVRLRGNLINAEGDKVPVKLVPEGNTIFRKVTFSTYKK
ncbi:MAG TPA: beta-L-arabinofuranosidase domain-containing protein [Bacteroidales bacterium]|nr:beta-L-arabinofuranosidase domain-containing protein [Bacteroidales bacterium]